MAIPNNRVHNIIECQDVCDVQKQIKCAAKKNKIVRVVGARHSVPDAIFASPQEPNIKLKLAGNLRKVIKTEEKTHENKKYLEVTVGAGCNLGVDPSDNESSKENSLNRIVNEKGYAFPILGGISHQTIGGFMMTSSAGGSLKHGFADILESFDFVDGKGNLQHVQKGTDEFNASAVSMGLFGIVTYVTIKLQENYLVSGTEETVSRDESCIKDATTLKDSLINKEYFHCMWFPAKDIDRVLQFTGKQVSYDNNIIKYHHKLENSIFVCLATLLLHYVNFAYNLQKDCILSKVANYLLKMINNISKLDFCDYWYIVLPNDDQVRVDDRIIIQFTEIWIDIDHIESVMKNLDYLFDKNPQAAGNLGVELYGAKQSPFWMSPSYGKDVVRVDAYWWESNKMGKQYDFFTTYWNTLLTIPTARLHWGKNFPKVGTTFNTMTIGSDYMIKSYPKFENWMDLRMKYDPDQIFVTNYWRELFGIEKK